MRVWFFDSCQVERPLHRQAPVQLDEPAGKPSLIGKFDKPFAAHLLLYAWRVSEEGFEITELAYELRSRFHANSGYTRNVVDRVAGQRLDIDNFIGGNAEFLYHFRFADHLVFHGVQHCNSGFDQLHQVLVGRDDNDVAPGDSSLASIGRNDVIGLKALLLDAGDVEGAYGIANERELRDEFRRRFRPVRLVIG